jgi:uncharacterized protein (DUF1501 family)
MAFSRDLGPLQQDVAVVVQSESCCRLRSNASGGTDHGCAGAVRVLGPRPAVAACSANGPASPMPHSKNGAALAAATDDRQVLAEVLTGHMGLRELAKVFPGGSAPVRACNTSKPSGIPP